MEEVKVKEVKVKEVSVEDGRVEKSSTRGSIGSCQCWSETGVSAEKGRESEGAESDAGNRPETLGPPCLRDP